MTWIKVIGVPEAQGLLRVAYDEVAAKSWRINFISLYQRIYGLPNILICWTLAVI